MKPTSFYISLFLFCFITSCANQSSPTGGSRDEDPPMLLSTIPEDQQLNFQNREIQLEFDELIAINNLNKQLIITPRTDVEYEVKYKNNRVTLKFEAPLDSNTTYTFNFREGIKDLNEGNVPETLSLAFSTGDYLDSMAISGTVSKLYTGVGIGNVSIALYAANDTMEVFSDPPLYLTKTNKSGNYLIQNLKIGEYKIIAFIDKNENLTLQSGNEAYGFSVDNILIDTIISNMNIPVFNLNVDSLKLQNARPSGHYFLLKYNKALVNYSVSAVDDSQTIYSLIDEEEKEIKIYNSFNKLDSLSIIAFAEDSIQQQRYDTLYLKFEETKRDKDEYSLKVTATDIDFDKPVIEAKFVFNKPSKFNNFDSLYFFIDSLTQINFDSSDFTWNNTFSNASLKKVLQKEQLLPKETGDTTANGQEEMTKIKPILYFGEGAFHSIESDTSEFSTSSFKKLGNANTGIIKINLENVTAKYTLQLLDGKNKIIHEILSEDNQSDSYVFNNLKAGEYKLRALVDANNNGIWELGNILKNTSPEPIRFYKSDEGNAIITLRANWEIGPLNFKL